MNDAISQFKEIIPPAIRDNLRMFKYRLFREKMIRNWKKQGYPVPPPHIVKQDIIREYASKYNLKILVETGTYLGDMVAAQRKYFNKIYSIELGYELWHQAKKRFKKYKNISILQGDSSKIIQEVLSELDQPALFWLDGHYSGGITAKGNKICPVYEELKAILNAKVDENVILIDDARLFNGEDDYPKYEELINYIKSFNINTEIKKEHDIIRIIVTAKKEMTLNK